MRDPHSVLLAPIYTEKSMYLRDEANQYSFEVPLEANKIEIRRAVKELFPKVKILKINTIRRRGKKRRVRGVHVGLTKRTKRAIITLAPGDTIELMG